MHYISNLMTIKEACQWATNYLNKNVSESNIMYLIQYGRIRKHFVEGSSLISRLDLEDYYNNHLYREISWKKQLGEDLNWALSFDQYSESETTKHVHRLHPYKGKFIPQLVEYFLDSHTDKFKVSTYFEKGDIILDPFCGSGTTLVQANELGIHAIGIDISEFNCMISNFKIRRHNLNELSFEINRLNNLLNCFEHKSLPTNFENELNEKLYEFNNKYFPTPDFKQWVYLGELDEKKYGFEKEQEFLNNYINLIQKYHIELEQSDQSTFLGKWYIKHIRNEIDFLYNQIKSIKNADVREIVSIILSRTIRSCRATTHSDLATLVKPVLSTYYCTKHKKICKPLFSLKKWWLKYSEDTYERIKEFEQLRTETEQICIVGDSRAINISSEISQRNTNLKGIYNRKRIKGIFTSPPYVGLIDYHEQHAYAYELLGLERKDDLEIGPLFRGQGREAKESYVKGISDVLINCKKYLCADYDVFLVANDKYNLYLQIAEKSGMHIVNEYKRPVLNRTEKDKGAYSESIFHLKEN